MTELSKDHLKELAAQHSQIFDAVDALRGSGLNMALIPKLVVLGDQKSGKSSVLEAISRIPFPVNEHLCTKFPIEVVQREAPKESIVITIVPAAKGGAGSASWDTFRLTVDSSNEAELHEAIQSATKCILGDTSKGDALKHFSEDILRVSVCGPGRYPLTIIDLPGLWVSDTQEQTTRDKESVNRMVRRYIGEPRNGLLLVMTASKQWVGHVAPNELRQVDPKGLRTLGIMTHPDKTSDDSAFHNLFNGKAPLTLKHGWHCLRNRSKEEILEKKERDDVESNYFERCCQEVDASCKGIHTLKPKLGSLFASQLNLHLPDLIAEVSQELKSVRDKLRQLKPVRMTEQNQRSFLTGVEADFASLCYNAVGGHYGIVQPSLPEFFHNPNDSQEVQQDKNLQAVVRALSQHFNSVMLHKGKHMNLLHLGNSLSDTATDKGRGGESAPKSSASKKAGKRVRFDFFAKESDDEADATCAEASGPTGKDKIDLEEAPNGEFADGEGCKERATTAINGSDTEEEDDDLHAKSRILDDIAEFDDLPPAVREFYRSQAKTRFEWRIPTHDASELLRHGILQRYEAVHEPEDRQYEWLLQHTLRLSARCRGTESLHEVNSVTVSQLIKLQTSKWRDISEIHFQEIWNAVERFVELALDHCVPDSMVRDLDNLIIRDRLDDLRRSTRMCLDELLECHTGMNPAFHDLLADLRENAISLDAQTGGTASLLLDVVEKEVFDRFSTASATRTMRNICASLWRTGIASGLSPTTQLAKLMIDKIQSQLMAAGESTAPDIKLQSTHRQKMEKLAAERAVNTLKEYYDVSITSYLANINALVIQNGLLRKLPLQIFSHAIVEEQSADVISTIAGPKQSEIEEQNSLEKRLKILEEGLSNLNKCRRDYS